MAQDNESCLVEDDKFVATTAKFNDQWEIIPLRPDLRPKEYGLILLCADNSVNPRFELRQPRLVHAAQSTCFIGVSPGVNDRGKEVPYASGNAFFVGPRTLITAAHLVPDTKRRILAQMPGTRQRTMLVETLFKNPAFEVLECKCIATGYPDVDISILQVVGSWRAEKYLEIKDIRLNPEGKADVDLMGYAGLYNEYYVQSMNPRTLPYEEVEDFIELFPKTKLLISHGPIVKYGIMPTYAVSTVSGMSGCPVLYDGDAIGK